MSGHKLSLVLALLSLQYIAVTPAYSFWLFKHKSHTQSTESNAPQTVTYPAYPQRISSPYASAGGSRLVPSYMMNKRTSTIPAKNINNIDSTKNAAVQETKKKYQTSENTIKSQSLANIQSAQAIDETQSKPILNTIPGTPLFPYSKTNIRIALGFNLPSAKIVVLDGAQLIDNSNNQVIANLPAQSEWLLSPQNNCIALRPDKDFYVALEQLAANCEAENNFARTIPVNYTAPNLPSSSKILSSEKLTKSIDNSNSLRIPVSASGFTIKSINNEKNESGLLAINGRVYHGDFLIKPNLSGKNISSNQFASNFNIINCLDLEDYLQSVVPSEMPSGWPLEALKAQAIAARSYALANLGKHGSAGYDLKDNIEDQAYSGVKSEADSTNEAVNATRGLVMRYDGKPICAYFHSCSGGSTERAEHVWHNSVPYLKAVIDFDQNAPMYNWTKNYSITQTESGLPKEIGSVLSITILGKSPSGRAKYILVNGTNGSRIISGEAARKYFNLPSTNFNVLPGESGYMFAGKGFGHGLGLSQWGAKSLAENGYNAAQILCYYYDGISIDY